MFARILRFSRINLNIKFERNVIFDKTSNIFRLQEKRGQYISGWFGQ
jgi:hypothetical protein